MAMTILTNEAKFPLFMLIMIGSGREKLMLFCMYTAVHTSSPMHSFHQFNTTILYKLVLLAIQAR